MAPNVIVFGMSRHDGFPEAVESVHAFFASRWYFKNYIERFAQPECERIAAILRQPV